MRNIYKCWKFYLVTIVLSISFVAAVVITFEDAARM